jgi:hypothetical protein
MRNQLCEARLARVMLGTIFTLNRIFEVLSRDWTNQLPSRISNSNNGI